MTIFLNEILLTFSEIDLEPRPEVAIDPERAALDGKLQLLFFYLFEI